MDIDELPRRLAAASANTAELATTLPDQAAGLILNEALPNTPRLSGALADTGRVEDDAVVFGSSLVDYAAAVHASQPWLEDAVAATEDAVADLAVQRLDAAVALT